jgi:antitoxin component of RelBE/YafQ-DinJ toxin-antitoxin module
MDTKLTLSFDQNVVEKAKKYAAANNISLSRLIEFLLTQVTSKQYQSLEDFPISDWVSQVAEGEVAYKRSPKSSRKDLKDEFFNAKKSK